MGSVDFLQPKPKSDPDPVTLPISAVRVRSQTLLDQKQSLRLPTKTMGHRFEDQSASKMGGRTAKVPPSKQIPMVTLFGCPHTRHTWTYHANSNWMIILFSCFCNLVVHVFFFLISSAKGTLFASATGTSLETPGSASAMSSAKMWCPKPEKKVDRVNSELFECKLTPKNIY